MSMFDDMDQMRQDDIVEVISQELFDQWVDSNLDEGTMYADYQICLMYGHPELQKQFNEYHNAEAGDELYFEVE